MNALSGDPAMKKRRWRTWGGRVVVTLLIIGAFVALVGYLPNYLVQQDAASGFTEAQIAQLGDARRTALLIAGGMVAVVTLYLTYLRHRLEQEKAQLDRDANATDRYTTAVEQLAHPSQAVRLGGIYALTRLADDSPRDADTIRDVLASFARASHL